MTEKLRFLNYFMHPSLKAGTPLYEKTKITVLVFITVLSIISVYGFFYVTQGYLWDIKALHNYLGISIVAFGLVLIKKTGKTDLALTIGSIMGIYLVSASVYLSGGIHSHDLLWYMVLSVAGFMFINIRSGIILTLLSLVGITFFYILFTYKIHEFSTDDFTSSITYKYFNFCLILSILALLIYILVRGNLTLQELVQLTKEQKIREEIARDFHDQIGNKLASIMHLSELMQMKKSYDEKDLIGSKIDHHAKDVYDNFRDFIWALDAKSDLLEELFMYLRDFTEDYFKFSDINLFITSSPDQLPYLVLPSNYSKEIVPMCKEIITNISKHAKARNVTLDFTLESNFLIITIKDDGVGMEKQGSRSGNGLKNIEKRALATGGELIVNTELNLGTEVIYKVLLP